MSGYDGKKPETKKEFINLLKTAKKEEKRLRRSRGNRSTKPTIKGTAEIMGIHRDTLYQWMREFDVDFSDVDERIILSEAPKKQEFTYLIGEALMGEGTEVAHVDLVIGNKDGPVGMAFANGMTNMSIGHTPLLAVIRPNLPPKPHTLLVPKVTIKNMEDTGKIFGPAQAAVAKAVADSVEEGIIPWNKVDEWVIICSVFIHPQAKDYRSIYHYNYGATKLALSRALEKYPTMEKVMYDKDRAKHPIMGFKVPRLWRPPYLQIALDNPNLEGAKKMCPSARTLMDVGAEQIRVVRYDEDGKAINYTLNQMCGAGLGTFAESMARHLGITLDELSELASKSQGVEPINAECGVYAGLDVATMIHNNTPKEDIARAIVEAIATKVQATANLTNIDKDNIVMLGGVARNKGVVDALNRQIS